MDTDFPTGQVRDDVHSAPGLAMGVAEMIWSGVHDSPEWDSIGLTLAIVSC